MSPEVHDTVEVSSAGELDISSPKVQKNSSAYGQPRGVDVIFFDTESTYVAKGGYLDSSMSQQDEDLVPTPALQREIDQWELASDDDLSTFESEFGTARDSADPE